MNSIGGKVRGHGIQDFIMIWDIIRLIGNFGTFWLDDFVLRLQSVMYGGDMSRNYLHAALALASCIDVHL